MTTLEQELVIALNYAADLVAHMQREGCPAGPVAVPSIINDALDHAASIEAAELNASRRIELPGSAA